MPLVTRAGDRGQLFKQATEPSGWLNADMWVDTDNSNVAVNRSGTAQQIAPGTTAAGDVLFSNGANTIDNLAIGTATQVLTTNAGADAPEWADAAGGAWSVIEDFINASTITSKTFTIDPAIDFDTVSKLVLIMDGGNTASLAMRVKFNGVTAGYAVDGFRRIGGLTEIDTSATSEAIFADTTLLNAASRAIHAELIFYLNKGGTADFVGVHSYCESVAVGGYQEVFLRNVTAAADISEIIIDVSTSSLLANFRMTLYQVSRV